jgi:hypothetical protein
LSEDLDQVAAELMERFKEEVLQGLQQGDGRSLLALMDMLLKEGAPLPDWLAAAWCAGYERWNGFEVRTLDEAFGVQRSPSFNLPAARKRHLLSLEVALDVRDEYALGPREGGVSREVAIERVAARRHLSAKVVEGYWRENAKCLPPFTPKVSKT